MRSTISLLLVLLFSVTLLAQDINIVPQPAEMTMGNGSFNLSATTVLVVKNGADDNTANFFNDYLKQFFGLKLKKVKSAASNYIQFTSLQTLVAGKEGAYSLSVSPKAINIQGQTASGTFYGMQTLIQLLPTTRSSKFSIPALTVNDEPRFGYRGMHLDVGRHFLPVSFVKKYIDYLALHKFNTFHWHLTEDQGWRIEIKKYPKLTSVGAWRNGTIIGRYPGKGNDGKRHGGFYTQAEIKEVVKYATARFIEIIPEIEMPGHSSAAIAAYPELSCFPEEPTKKYFPKQCTWSGDTTGKQVQQTWGVFSDVFCAGKENTFQFLQDVIDEVAPLFPSKYIHVGGDECPKENWKRCPLCQQRMKDNNLKNEHELQSYFIQRMEKYLNEKGKTLIGWDEILEGGLAPNAIVMSWRGEEGGTQAAREKHKVIMAPNQFVYLNYSQTRNEDSVTIGGYLPLEKVYNYEPVPKDMTADDSKYVLGANGELWTEYIGNEGIAQYMLFPRLSALSEVLWSPKDKRDYKDFEKRLPGLFKRYDQWKVHYSKAYYDLKTSIVPQKNNHGIRWTVTTKTDAPITLYASCKTLATQTDTVPVYDVADPTKLVRYKILKPGDSINIGVTVLSGGVDIRESGYYTLQAYNTRTMGFGEQVPEKKPFTVLHQAFHLNKATGKEVILSTPPSDRYPGDGAFTLVNGVQNERGLERSSECLGFEGPDCEAIIDLGSNESISNAVIHTLNSGGSWVYPPKYVEVFASQDGTSFTSVGKSEKFEPTNGLNGVVKVNFNAVSTRYIKVFVKNFGLIPSGMSGAGNNAWLFVDEIEVN